MPGAYFVPGTGRPVPGTRYALMTQVGRSGNITGSSGSIVLL